MNNPVDWIKIAVVAYVGIFLINKALDKFGLSQFKA